MLSKKSEDHSYTSLAVLTGAAFLTPIIGGHLAIGTLPISTEANPLVLALRGLPQASPLSHAILAGLCAYALVDTLVESRTVLMPKAAVSRLLFALMAFIAISVCLSSFLPTSAQAALDWMSYGIAFFAVLTTAGNANGSKLMLCGLFCGCVTVSGLGILEYLSMTNTDPSWRIFSVWEGPNALAGMLLIGFFVGLGLTLVSSRLWAVAAGIGSVSIGLGISLCQSKGGIIALAVGAVLFLGLAAARGSKKLLFRSAGTVLGVVALIVASSSALSAFAHATVDQSQAKAVVSSEQGPFSRIVMASESSDQSVEFRKLLWESGLQLILRHPLGTGIGTFQYFSAQPGLVTQTYVAHEAVIELADEASPLAAATLVCLIVAWVSSLLKTKSGSPDAEDHLVLGVVVAVIAVMLHGLVDSDLSYFGIGIAIFMLLGAGLLLKSESVQPKTLSIPLRAISTSLVVVVSGASIVLGFLAAWRGEALYAVNRRLPEAGSRLAFLKSWAPWDAEVWSISAQISQDRTEALGFAHKSAELCPDTEYLQLLATSQAQSKKYGDAIATLRRALVLDPNNLPVLSLISRIQLEAGLSQDYAETLRALVRVEATSVFRIRSLPDVIPTETYSARVLLAKLETDQRTKTGLLEPAVEGYKQYVARTLPNVLRVARGYGAIAKNSGQEAAQRLKEASSAAGDLAAAYAATGKTKEAAALHVLEKSFRTQAAQLTQDLAFQ